MSERVCPNCGADWSQSMRVARKSRSRTPDVRKIMRHAAKGALVALVLSALAYVLVNALASAAAGGERLPPGFGARLGLVVDGVVGLLGAVGATIVRHARLILTVLLVVAVGAIGGVLFYALNLGRLARRSSDSSRRARRKRRRT